MQLQNEMKKRKAPAVCVMVILILATIATVCWFISQVNINGSLFNTGTIDFVGKAFDDKGELVSTILPEGKSTEGVEKPNQPIFNKSEWKAGDCSSCYISVEKTGSLDMEYDLTFSTLLTSEDDAQYLGGYWYRITEITSDIGELSGTDDERIVSYANKDENKPIACDCNSQNPVHCLTVDGQVKHTCTECSETSYNMSTIDRANTRGTLTEEGTKKRYYKIDYGIRHTSTAVEYTNRSICVSTKINATQIGALENPDGTGKIFAVSDRATLDDALDNALPGDSIKLSNDITYDGDLVFSKAINMITAGRTLSVNGNVLYNYASAHDLKIDLTGAGTLKVAKNGVAGGNFTINTPNSNVSITGSNTFTGDLLVSSNFTVNATNAYGSGGCVLTDLNTKNDTNLPKEMYLQSNTKLTVNPKVHVSRVEACAQSTNIEIVNSGEIDEIVLSSMNELSDVKAPQIKIDNYYKITNPIVLPVWSSKFVITSNAPLTTEGNTEIIRNIGATEMDVNAKNFKKSDIVDKTNVDKYVEQMEEGSDSKLRVYFRDKTVGTTSSLESFLTDYFSEKQYTSSAITEALNNITQIEVDTIGNKVMVDNDLRYLSDKLVNLSYIDLENANIQDNQFGQGLFNRSNLTNFILPKNIEKIYDYTFKSCGIKDITVPSSFTYLGRDVFSAAKVVHYQSYVPCSYVVQLSAEIMVPEGALSTYRTKWYGVESHILPESVACDDGDNYVRKVDDTSYELTYYMGTSSDITAGSNLKLNGRDIIISKVGEYSFRRLSQGFTLNFESNVNSIGCKAFYGRTINNIYFNNVKDIGPNAFETATINDIDFSNVETIGSNAFASSTIHNIDFKNVLNTGDSSFASTTINSIDFSQVKTIGTSSFKNCAINSVDFKNVETINSGAFFRSTLQTVDFSNVKEIGSQAFYACNSLTEIDTKNVVEISTEAFRDCANLCIVNMPNVEKIYSDLETGPFRSCSNLVSVSFGKALGIPSGTFRLCAKLYEINLNSSTVSSLVYYSIYAGSTNFKIYVPMELLDDYRSSCPEYKSHFYEMGNKVGGCYVDLTGTPGTALADQQICHYNLGAYITKITDNSETSIITCNKTIDSEVYNVPGSLKDIDYSIQDDDNKTITAINDYAYYLTTMKCNEMNIAESITSIGRSAFYNKTNLKSVNTNNVLSVGMYSFKECDNLSEFIANKLETIGDYSFSNDHSLYKIDFPSAVSFGTRTFEFCENLIKITIGENCESMNSDPFYKCANLRTVECYSKKVLFTSSFNNPTTFPFCHFYGYEDIANSVGVKFRQIGGRIEGENIVTATYNGETIGSVDVGNYTVKDVDGGVSIYSINLTNDQVSQDFVLPESLSGKSIVRLDDNSFADFPFNKISLPQDSDNNPYGKNNFIIPKTVTSIGKGAFYQTKVSLSDLKNVMYVEQNAFYDCDNIYGIKADELIDIGANAFSNCSNMYVFDAPNATTFSDFALYQCANLTQLVTNAQSGGTNWIAFDSKIREMWIATKDATTMPSITSSINNASVFSMIESSGAGYHKNDVTRYGSDKQQVIDANGDLRLEYDLGEYMYREVNGQIQIVSCQMVSPINGTMESPYAIPGIIDGKNVVSIERFAFKGTNFNGAVIDLPNSLLEIGEGVFTYKNIVGTLNLKNVSTVNCGSDNGTFKGSKITSFIAPNLITINGRGVLQDCKNLISVEMPKVTSLADLSFGGCTALKTIYFENVISVGSSGIFSNTDSLTSITFNKSVSSSSLPNWGYSLQQLKSSLIIYVPTDSVDYFKNSTGFSKFNILPLGEGFTDSYGNIFYFTDYANGLKLVNFTTAQDTVTIPESFNDKNVVAGGENTFNNSTASTIILPKYFKYYSNNMFGSNNYIKNVDVNADNEYFKAVDGVLYTKDGTELVYYPKNRTDDKYVIPDDVKMVRSFAFNGSINLKSIGFPSSLVVIGSDAFKDTVLDYVVFNGTTPPMMTGTNIFDCTNSSFKIYVPSGMVDTYKKSNGFVEFDISDTITDSTPPDPIYTALPPSQENSGDGSDDGNDGDDENSND